MNVLVTGATGFVGRQLCSELINRGHCVSALVRQRQFISGSVSGPISQSISESIPAEWVNKVNWHSISGLDDRVAIETACEGVEVVIHLAARVHQMGDAQTQEHAYDRINRQGALSVAGAASAAGVRRFIFLSSIKVNGEERKAAYSPCDTPSPQGAYACSKYAAEQELQALAQQRHLELVIIRPPLVYGSGVKANFLQLISWVRRGVPLPLAAINNQRSLLSVDNLVDLLCVCISHPKACDQVLLASDGETVTTSLLIERIAQAYAVDARLFKCPVMLLRVLARLTGRSDSLNRLLGSLTIDIDPTCQLLNWSPPVSMIDTLSAMAATEIKKDERC